MVGVVQAALAVPGLRGKGLHLRWRVAAHLLGLLACVLTGAANDDALALYQALNLDSNEGKFYGLQDTATELGAKGKAWEGQYRTVCDTHKGDQVSPLVSNPLFQPCEAPCRSGAAMAEPVLCHQDRNPTVLARDDAGSINKMPSSSSAPAATPAARQRRGWDLPKKTTCDSSIQQSLPRWCSPQAPPGTPAQDSSRPVVYSSSSSSNSSSGTDVDKSSSSSSSRNFKSITRSGSSSSSKKSSSSRGINASQSPVRSLSGTPKLSTPLAARSSSTYRHKQSAAAAAGGGGGGGLYAAGKAADARIKSEKKPAWK
ncbi:hypothetical protein COO60DRAFT_1704314 [Scenedesmus sp. NREL 46B-D3]|nr:hypothetical protein COO60DRAFT_1704314 [Scenedesmus sp. NREL 46B-D3]